MVLGFGDGDGDGTDYSLLALMPPTTRREHPFRCRRPDCEEERRGGGEERRVGEERVRIDCLTRRHVMTLATMAGAVDTRLPVGVPGSAHAKAALDVGGWMASAGSGS